MHKIMPFAAINCTARNKDVAITPIGPNALKVVLIVFWDQKT